MSDVDLPPLEPDDVLTQFGRRGPSGWRFRNLPKADQDEVSLLAGRYPVDRATVLIAKRDLDSGDAVRYARLRYLEDAGFELTRTPNRRNPDHVSVKFEGVWDDSVGERFDACFDEPVTQEDEAR